MKFSNKIFLLKEKIKDKIYLIRIKSKFNLIKNRHIPTDKLIIDITENYCIYRSTVVNSHIKAIKSILNTRYENQSKEIEFYMQLVFELKTPADILSLICTKYENQSENENIYMQLYYKLGIPFDILSILYSPEIFQLKKLIQSIILFDVMISIAKTKKLEGIAFENFIISNLDMISAFNFDIVFDYFNYKYFPPIDTKKRNEKIYIG